MEKAIKFARYVAWTQRNPARMEKAIKFAHYVAGRYDVQTQDFICCYSIFTVYCKIDPHLLTQGPCLHMARWAGACVIFVTYALAAGCF